MICIQNKNSIHNRTNDKVFHVLDVLIIKENINISTDVFYIETDSHQCLIFYSCHPSHTKGNIPFNVARRICTIVSDEERINKRLKELKHLFVGINTPMVLSLKPYEMQKIYQFQKYLKSTGRKHTETVQQRPNLL